MKKEDSPHPCPLPMGEGIRGRRRKDGDLLHNLFYLL
jgi:hypothetical protein